MTNLKIRAQACQRAIKPRPTKFARQTLGLALIALSLAGCSTVGNMFTGKGLGEVVDLKNGTFEITAAGSFSANRTTTYEKWDRTAAHACGDRPYTVIKRDWQSAEYPGILSGTIRCK